MNTWNRILAMVRADLQERTRHTSFLVTVCLIIYLGYAVNTGQIFIKLETYRGIYNSAWVGSLMSLVITFFLGIAGFYLTKNAVERDDRTGVGQIIATTPITRPQYLLAKWLSNFALLAALVGILALAAIFMQMISREDAHIQLWALLAPFLFIALPMMALVAAIAIFFESVPWLKGGFGNLVYFGIFISLFMAGIFLPNQPWLDVTGISLVGGSMKAATRAAFPTYGSSLVLSMASEAPVETFVWSGVSWTLGLIIQRILWLLVSVGIVLAGSLFFQRFDPNRSSSRKRKPEQAENLSTNGIATMPERVEKTSRLAALPEKRAFHMNYIWLIWLELLLLVKGLKWYWWAGMIGIWVGSIFAENETMRQIFFNLSAIWPVLIWSKMGGRESRYQTEQLIYQSAYPLTRVLIASWLAGVIVTALSISGVLVGRLISGAPADVLPWILSVLFIPTLALALGTWSHSSKLFEVIYPIMWYLGPFNHESGLEIIDYLGIHTLAPINTIPLVFASGVCLLLILALIGRRRQMAV